MSHLIDLLITMLVVMMVLPLSVAMFVYFERKVIGWMHARMGPNRVGPLGLLQTIADVLKLLMKEIILPTNANKTLFMLAPLMALIPSFAAWAVMPISSKAVLANLDAGLLYILAMTSLGVYGVIVAGWASNSKYAFLGAMRSAAQIVSYEIAMGFALVGVLIAAGSLNLVEIVEAQRGGFFDWFWLPLFPLFVIYLISGVAETNRAPFDVAEGESEIVAGFHVEYSGSPFALFFLTEYTNMILIAALCTVMFAGGWLSPVPALIPDHSLWWLVKTIGFCFFYLWFRATFPRFRYDQIMRLGWKVFIPITIVALLLAAVAKLAGWFVIGA